MKNNKGQSLIDVIFSMGIIVLVLTGVVILVVSTAKVKRLAFERQKAIELSQLLIENKVLESKNDQTTFWNGGYSNDDKSVSDFGDFSGYQYSINPNPSCNNQSCNLIFTVKWEGVGKSLSVERLFLRKGI